MLSKISKAISGHKIMSSVIFLIIVFISYFGYKALAKDNNLVRYATAAVEKGTLIISVSGSGQVSALDQLDIKSKVKGDVLAVYVNKGQEIKKGEIIARLDSADFQKAVSDAQDSLETAQIELEDLSSPPDELTLLKAENTIIQSRNSLERLRLDQTDDYQKALDTIKRSKEDIESAYKNTLNTITNAFGDMPAVMTGLNNILYSYEIAQSEITLSNYQWNISVYENAFESQDRSEVALFIRSAEDSYKQAKKNYDQNFENYKKTRYDSDEKIIEDLLNQTIETAESIAQAVKDQTNLISLVINYLSNHNQRVYNNLNSYQADLKSYSSKATSHYSSLLSIQRTLEDSREAKTDAEQDLAEMEKTQPLDLQEAEISLAEKEKSLTELKAGPDELDIRAKKLVVEQKQDTLISAKQDLADCNIFAPFDGIITEVKAKKHDSVSAGAILANIITHQKIAEITLNEIDVAKIKIGQKANITFDALEDLNITGEVIEADTLGTTTQGVVTYGVKIAFDAQDDRIKPGMSLSTEIITSAKQNILVVPSSAIKQNSDMSYVQILSANIASAISVQIGLSNDTMTEILDGLKQGDIIVTQTINQNQNSNQQLRTDSNQVQMRQMQQQMQRMMR